MSTLERRTFMQAGVTAAATLATALPARAAEPEKIRVGIIGPGGMGSNHLRLLAKRADVEITHVCDPDAPRLATAAEAVEDLSK